MASSMSTATEARPVPVHTCELLDRTAVWQIHEEDRRSDPFARLCAANTALAFRRRDIEVVFCILISPGVSHIATVSVSDAETTSTITAVVYRLSDDGFTKNWSVTHMLDRPAGLDGDSFRSWERHHMHGGVTEDGESVMILRKPKRGSTSAFTLTRDGFVSRLPPSDTADRYLMNTGKVSDDGEYIFYTRTGQKFGSGGQAEAVEIYSLRSLIRLKAVTFSFGDGRLMRNTRLMRPLRLHGPVHMAVTASSFRGDDLSVPPTDTMLLASSDGKLHSHVSGLDTSTGTGSSSNGSISPDGSHLVCIDKDEGLRQWDLKRPTLKPIGSATLPGVLYGANRRWLIYGKETMMRDAVPDQLHTIRYSPVSKVVTVVTVGAGQVVVNVFLTFNLQLVYHRIITHLTWPGFKALRVGFNESLGLTVVAMSPTTTVTRSGVDMVVGVLGVVLPLKNEFRSIRKIEDYFDYGRVGTVGLESINRADTIPECRFSWRPDAFEKSSGDVIVHEFGQAPVMSTVDARRQKDFFDKIFANPQSSTRIESFPETRQFIMPHLFSFSYPWAPDQTVSIFGIVMKYQYHIITIGSSPSGNRNDIIRVLYANEIKTALRDGSELIEIYKTGANYILYVSQDKGSMGAYSGAPMPRLRRTIASPHFVKEDAWYDTFVVHAAKHVTMPTGWTSTPNGALMATANIHAYFQPGSFETNKVIDYGHRTSAAYVGAKYLLWMEYGLRGSRKARSADIFFGGGTYADSLGPYLRSIYDDRIYDDRAPLFSSSLALTCNAAYRSRETRYVDAFFRRLHQEDQLVLNNSQSVSNTLPLACRARPMAALSFIRHLVLFHFKINDIGIVEARGGASGKGVTSRAFDGKWWHQIREITLDLFWRWMWPLWIDSEDFVEEPNTKHVTLPLQDFCSFENTLHHPPPRSNRDQSAFWEFILAVTQYDGDDEFPRWERQILAWVVRSSRGPASPFTRMVEEILNMKDREMQLSFLRVAWLEKLLAWKLKTFGLHIYLTRNVLPIVLLFVMNLSVGVLLTGSDSQKSKGTRIAAIILASIEGLISGYVIYTKARQLFRVPRLFLSSIPNYIDFIALLLGIAMFGTVAAGTPSREFLAFSTLFMWVAAILMLRVYRPVGMLLLLLTETMQGVFPFLTLLIFIILGFAFVPYVLLRNRAMESGASNVFSSFPLTIAQMINFMASDYDALQPFEDGSAAVRTLKALYIVVITVLFLNTLIAILNLKIKRADRNAAKLYHLQMASLQVQIEIGLLSASERARHDWFPQWFSYSMTETEERTWKEFVENQPLKWTEENSFSEAADHVPRAPTDLQDESLSRLADPATVTTEIDRSDDVPLTSANTPTTPSTSTPRTTSTTTAAESTTAGQTTGSTQQTRTASQAHAATESNPLIVHNKKPVEDLLSALEPFDVSQLPHPIDSTRSNLLNTDEDLAHNPAEDDDLRNQPVERSAGGESSSSTTQPPPANAQPTAVKKAAAENSASVTNFTAATGSGSNPTSAATQSIQMTHVSNNSCMICGQPGSKCQGCRTVAYCSKEHQRQDWKRHKSACKGKGREAGAAGRA